MNLDFRALPWRCLFAAVGAAAGAASADAAQSVSCATPDAWSGAPRVSQVALRTAAAPADVRVSARTWSPVYRGDGVGRLHGATKARVLRYGVLWTVDPSDLGVSSREAVSALIRAGAAIARADGEGKVYFRARRSDYERVAARAASMLGSTGTVVRTAAIHSGLGADVAMMRVEGRASADPVQFIDSLPGGMEILPFGTSFVVRVPASQVESMWNALDEEGRRILLVGASSGMVPGAQAAQAIGSCGGAALMGRFPTPSVVRVSDAAAVFEVESQRVEARRGDVLLVVQAPPYGRGIEVALIRVVAR